MDRSNRRWLAWWFNVDWEEEKKREIESSDEDSRWQFFSLVVIVYTKIRQAYSLFVFHARVTPCRHTHTHTHIAQRRMSAIQHLREEIKFYRKFSFTHHFAWINDSTRSRHTSKNRTKENYYLFTMPFRYPLKKFNGIEVSLNSSKSYTYAQQDKREIVHH